MEEENKLEKEFYARLIKLALEFRGLEPEYRIHSMISFACGDMYMHFNMKLAKPMFKQLFEELLEKTEEFDNEMRKKNG